MSFVRQEKNDFSSVLSPLLILSGLSSFRKEAWLRLGVECF